jgi:TonB family protein
MAAAIFISYRRDDSIANAGRLYDHLAAEFGRDRVFMDVDAIQPGEDFVEVIQRKVASCDALVIVIGRQWLAVQNERGMRRLDDPDDYVVLEIRAALERKIPIIPVLVSAASAPKAEDLPESLKALARRQALPISDTDFRTGMSRLIDTLRRHTTVRQSESAYGVVASAPARSASPSVGPGAPPAPALLEQSLETGAHGHDARRRVLMFGAPAAALLLLVLLLLPGGSETPDLAETPDRSETSHVTTAPIERTAEAPQVPATSSPTRTGQRVQAPGGPAPVPSTSASSPARAREPVPSASAPHEDGEEAQRQRLLNQVLENLQPSSSLRDAASKLASVNEVDTGSATPIGRGTSAASSSISRIPNTAAPTKPVRVGGDVQAPRKLTDVRPVYPPIAASAKVQGAVLIEATIGVDGRVTDARILRAIPLLDQAALDAVRQWEFAVTYLNGVPVPVIMTVTVQFTLD